MNIDIDMNKSRKGDRHKNKGDRHNNKGDRHKKDAEGKRINSSRLNLNQKGVYSTYIDSLSPTSKQLVVDTKRTKDRERYRIKKYNL